MNIKRKYEELKRESIITLTPPIPKNILIELSNICNHQCIFCANKKMKRKKGVIDRNFCLNIIKQAYDAGTREIGFYLTGEPFVCKELEEYVEYAKKLGYTYIYITTNGALASLERVKKLVENGLDSIKFSVNAATRETYKVVHGKDDFETVIRNIKEIAKYRKSEKLDFSIHISYVVTKLNQDEEQQLKLELENDVDDFFSSKAYNSGGNMYENNEIAVDSSTFNVSKPCFMVFNRLHVTYDGFLNACCIDFDNYMAVADLYKMSLVEAWHCDTMINLRKQLIEDKVKDIACYNCINNTNAEIRPINEAFTNRVWEGEK